MPSDYKAITKHNERKLGVDTTTRKTQISMYSDPTHFVYEILQNADDHGATEVCFKLSKDELQVEYDGEPFTKKHVEAITYFGKSTSRDDLVKTGRFGIGFKSVFAFTATPTIISGDEHFQIYGLYRVREYPYPDHFSRSRTRIILPFDHESEKPDYVEDWMPQKKAYSDIANRLTKLNMNTLLFTHNIREIHWKMDGSAGHYLREDDTEDNHRWTTIKDGKQREKYLVFSRVPQWNNQEYKAVEIAFAVDEKNQLSPMDDFLYVLFPTTQETRLQFILNGPYRTTPSRETIAEDNPFNRHLMEETCTLMKDLLPQLRKMGLLTTRFLSVLPNKSDELRDFYAPLLDAIVETFREQELVPTDDNQYACASHVLQGPARLREVITKEELAFFVGREDACWAKGVSPNSRADYFLRTLEIQQWEWKQLQGALWNKYGGHFYGEHFTNDEDHDWLIARSDSWLQKLYILLADSIGIIRVHKDEIEDESERGFREALKSCRIIRVRKDRKETHVAGSSARFPKKGYQGLPQVKPAILRDRYPQREQKIQESLGALGVSEIGDEDRIDLRLEKYYGDEEAEVTDKQHLQHMRIFIRWWEGEKNASKFENHAIFRVEGREVLYKPASECFFDLPFEDTGLEALFGCSAIPLSKRKHPISRQYERVNGFKAFAKALGVMHALEIRECEATRMQEDVFPKVGSKTKKTEDRDYSINALHGKGTPWWQNKESDDYVGDLDLEMHRIELSLAVWKTLCHADAKVLYAFYLPNSAHRDEQKRAPSFLVNQLKSCEWIPDKDNRFRFPRDVTRKSLHPDFPFDNENGWLDAIGFGESAKKAKEECIARNHRARKMGFASAEEMEKMAEIAALWRNQGKSPDELISRIAPQTRAEFPTRMAANPERRKDRLSQQLDDAPEKEYDSRERKVRTTRGRVDPAPWLREQYLNQDGQMICQVCKEEMPFRKRDGEHYFEAVEMLSIDHFTREHEAQFLALCPLCAAMYKEFIKQDEEAMMDLKNALMNADDFSKVPLRLGERDRSLRFVETHYRDIKTILERQE